MLAQDGEVLLILPQQLPQETDRWTEGREIENERRRERERRRTRERERERARRERQGERERKKKKEKFREHKLREAQLLFLGHTMRWSSERERWRGEREVGRERERERAGKSDSESLRERERKKKGCWTKSKEIEQSGSVLACASTAVSHRNDDLAI